MIDTLPRLEPEQKNAVLLLEAAALIHDIGKLSNGFILSRASDRPDEFKYGYRWLADPARALPSSIAAEIVGGDFGAPYKDAEGLTDALLAKEFVDWNGERYNLAEVLLYRALEREKIRKSLREGTGKSFQPAILISKFHGLAHFEKERDDDNRAGRAGEEGQPYRNTYRASPFGVEEVIPVDRPDADLTTILRSVAPLQIAGIGSVPRDQWLSGLRRALHVGIADTRRPANEVTLWDWGFIVATLVKPAVWWIYRKGWPRHDDVGSIAFRTLEVNLDLLGCLERGDGLADVEGIKRSIDESFEMLRVLIEEELALANCFHQDETGAYYLVSDCLSEQEVSALRRRIQEGFPPDLIPRVSLAEPVSGRDLDFWAVLRRLRSQDRRSGSSTEGSRTARELVRQAVAKLLAEPRREAQGKPPVDASNNLYTFEREWGDGRPESAEVCSVCGLLPIGYPRTGSSPVGHVMIERWATEEKARERRVCRVCLGRRGRRAQDWATEELGKTIWLDEVADENGRVAVVVGRLGLERWLDGSALESARISRNVAKNPSPIRLYRIVETCRSFWECAAREAREEVGRNPRRLAIYPTGLDVGPIGDYHAYELAGVGRLPVVWDPKGRRFLTAINLSYFAKSLNIQEAELSTQIQRRELAIFHPSGFGGPGAKVCSMQTDRVEELGPYSPAVDLLVEPSLALLLIPAAKALDVALRIKGLYERQMGRVRDRLPIYLGLVFFERRQPISAALDAARAMSRIGGAGMPEPWALKSRETEDDCVRLKFESGMEWRVPYKTPDGQLDEWYPNMWEGSGEPHRASNGDWKNVRELRNGDERIPKEREWWVWVRPSLFDFEFLDTTARRFDIRYDERGRRLRRTRPFHLEDLDRLEMIWRRFRSLPMSQRQQVVRVIEGAREAWFGRGGWERSCGDSVFRQFVKDTLAGASWPEEYRWPIATQDIRDEMVGAAVRGELADWAELHMEILKER